MNMVALFWEDIYIYFHGIVIALATLITIVLAIVFCKVKCNGSISMMLNVALLSLPFGIVFSRGLYCLSNYTEFREFYDIINMTDGGYSLYGAFLGVAIAVFLAHWIDNRNSLGVCFDCIAVAAALGISIGRMGSYFSFDNVGIVMNDIGYCMFPFSVYNPITSEWCLATFVFEALVEFIMFFCLLAALIDNYDTRKPINCKKGDVCLLFIMMHGALESLADSMHTDALRFPFNSFVRVQQIIAVFSLAIVFIIFWIRAIKKDHKFTLKHFVIFALFAAMVGLAAYMEFARISNTNYWFNHGVMLICLLGCTLLSVMVYRSTTKNPTANN